jgi:hypothetical protein
MQDEETQESDQGEETQIMEMEKVESNIEESGRDQGEQESTEMNTGQTKHLHQESRERNNNEIGLGILTGSSGSMGIKTKPLKILKKNPSEENKRGKNPTDKS